MANDQGLGKTVSTLPLIATHIKETTEEVVSVFGGVLLPAPL